MNGWVEGWVVRQTDKYTHWWFKLAKYSLSFDRLLKMDVILLPLVVIVNAIVSAKTRDTAITDVSNDDITQYKLLLLLLGWFKEKMETIFGLAANPLSLLVR